MGLLSDQVEEYVAEQLAEWKNQGPVRKQGKVIHDSIWGTNLFFDHEIPFINSPFLQRLRQIHQVGTASLVFPSANHSRFEHSLGVTVVATKLMESLRIRHRELFSDDGEWTRFLYEVRLAAILHDIGHGPFSHVSETLFSEFSEFNGEVGSVTKFHDRKPHEIMSSLIVRSKCFQAWANGVLDNYKLKLDLNRVADVIIGDGFLADVINGPFDADKLDYLQRDAQFTGLKLGVDLDRLLYTLEVIEDERIKGRLGIDLTGVSTLEQILFDKMMLHSKVYHHHKVRAAECMVKATLDYMMSPEVTTASGMKVTRVTDFLRLNDADFLAKSASRHQLGDSLQHLQNRNLLMRGLVVSESTVNADDRELLYRLMSASERISAMKKLRDLIYQEVKKEHSEIQKGEIWVDFPKAPSFEEAAQCMVKTYNPEGNYTTLHNIFPVDNWVGAFGKYKWKGYVFCPEYARQTVHQAARAVIEEHYDIRFNENALRECKM